MSWFDNAIFEGSGGARVLALASVLGLSVWNAAVVGIIGLEIAEAFVANGANEGLRIAVALVLAAIAIVINARLMVVAAPSTKVAAHRGFLYAVFLVGLLPLVTGVSAAIQFAAGPGSDTYDQVGPMLGRFGATVGIFVFAFFYLFVSIFGWYATRELSRR